MNTVIRKIGNSEGVILPKELLTKLNLQAGDFAGGQGNSGRSYADPCGRFLRAADGGRA